MAYIRIEYMITIKENIFTSPVEFDTLVDQMARNATVGPKSGINLNGIVSNYEQILDKYGAKYKVKNYEVERRTGSCYIDLPLANFDFDFGGIPLMLGVIAGDIIGDPRIDAAKITEVILPEQLIEEFQGPKVGLEGIRNDIFNLGERPLLAFTMKPRLGLDPEQHAKVCYEALLGGCDIAEDDERLVNPSYCTLKDRIKNCILYSKKAEDKIGEKKVYSINLTGRAEKITEIFIELENIARKSSETGIECVKIDVLPAGFNALQALSEFFYRENKRIIITVYPEMYYFYSKLIPRDFIMTLARLCGADIMYAATPIIYTHHGPKGEPTSIDPEILSKVKKNYYQDILWNTETFKNIKKTMPTVTGKIHPGTMELLYRFLGKNIGYFIGWGIASHPKGIKHGAEICRSVLDGIIKGQSLADILGEEERLLLDSINMKYADFQQIIGKQLYLKEYLE